ncbi:hypothetical protein ACAG39_11180 [Caldicellulosiruptoraceae bacterium PP1]
MNLRPIDAKILLPKSTEVSQIVYAEQQKENLQKQDLIHKNQNRIDNNLKSIHAKDEVSQVKINEKQKEQNQKKKKEEKKKKGFDIRI